MSVSRETSVRREHDAQVLRSVPAPPQGGGCAVRGGGSGVRAVHPGGEGELQHDRLPAGRRAVDTGARRHGAVVRRGHPERASVRRGHRPGHGRAAFPRPGRRRRRGRGDVAGQRGGHEEAARRAGRGRDGVVGDRRRVSVPAGHRRGERGDGHRGGARGRPGYGRVAGVAVGRCREHRQRAKLHVGGDRLHHGAGGTHHHRDPVADVAFVVRARHLPDGDRRGHRDEHGDEPPDRRDLLHQPDMRRHPAAGGVDGLRHRAAAHVPSLPARVRRPLRCHGACDEARPSRSSASSRSRSCSSASA